MQQVGQYRVYQRGRDPAPTRLRYRLERLRLARGIARLFRVWLPLAALFVGGMYLYKNEALQSQIQTALNDMRQTVEERPEFMIRLVSIQGASGDLGDAIRSELGITLPVSSLALDLPVLQSQVAKMAPVSDVEIFFRDGGVLQVDVTERAPFAVWRNPEGVHVVDATGHVVEVLAARWERAELPLIAGEGANTRMAEADALLSVAAPLQDDLRGLVFVGERRWDVVLEDGIRILLPEENPVPALERVIALDQAQDLFAREITTIDMRLEHRPTLRLSSGAMSELRRIRGIGQEITQDAGPF